MAIHLSTRRKGLSGTIGMKHGGKHPGFKTVQSQITSKQGISRESAGAILAASTRGASAAAKRKNPRLRKVKARGGIVGKISKEAEKLIETFRGGGKVKFIGGAGAVKFVNGKFVNIKQKKKTA